MEDPTLLALVVDDPLAPRVLAAWKALRLELSGDAEATCSRIALLVQGSLQDTARTLERCKLAGLLVDGGISGVADSWLGAHVGSRLSARPRKDGKKSKGTT